MTAPGTRVAIVGAGTMGRRLAYDFARSGSDVVLHDAAPEVARGALAWLAETLGRAESEGALPAGTARAATARLHVAATLAQAVDGAPFVFENVPERLPLKRELFAAMAPLLAEPAIVVSNTSSLPGSLMADASGRPDRFVNANFSHLGHAKVEVMPNPATAADSCARLLAYLRGASFVPILLRREQFGYAGNRVWRAVKREVLRQLAEGVATPEDLDRSWMHDFGMDIGPCGIMDAVGLDVVADIEQAYADHAGDPGGAPPPFLRRMVAEGRLGVKSGEGFYRYPGPAFARPGFLDGEPS